VIISKPSRQVAEQWSSEIKDVSERMDISCMEYSL